MSDKINIPSKRFLFIGTVCIIALALVGGGFLFGLLMAGPNGNNQGAMPAANTAANADAETADAGPQMYTCSMHPQVRLPDPNAKCPICFMDLIPVEEGEDSGGDASAPILGMSPAAMKLAEIETAPVRRLLPRVEVRMVGKIDYDETRLATISAYIPGRLDDLYVDYTGVPVKKGDHLVSIYSPDLLAAEAELLSSLEALLALDGRASESAQSLAGANVQAAREKLRLWGLTDEQIRKIEKTGQISDHMTIYAPIGGVVIRKHKTEGEYVQTGEPIYSVADLSRLWVRLDAYESDLRWLRYGQDVEFATEAFPGEVFHGTVAFIDPHVSPETRTVKLRLNVENPDGRLKPGMFVRATVRPVIAGDGEVVASELAGKMICPMHPEIVKDEQVPCDICGMDLVPAESLGYVSMANGHEPPLVIPASAPLITGLRAIVYVQLTDREKPTFEGREIVLGPKAGDYYLVREDAPGGPNLAEGDLVVVQGNFKIDSALQIQAKKSMMSPADDDEAPAPETQPDMTPVAVPSEFVAGLTPLFDAYLWMQEGLAADRLPVFKEAALELHTVLGDIDAEGLSAEAQLAWDGLAMRLGTDREHIDHIDDLERARKLFEVYSDAMIELGKRFGYEGTEDVNIAFCPMAFDFKGASWLQVGDQINNPYFGDEMLRCGELRGSIGMSGEDGAEDAPTDAESGETVETEGDSGNGLPTDAQAAQIVNDICPVMGNPVDPETPTAAWRGHTIGFCCGGCDGPWNEKSDAEKDAFLARYVPEFELPNDNGGGHE